MLEEKFCIYNIRKCGNITEHQPRPIRTSMNTVHICIWYLLLVMMAVYLVDVHMYRRKAK